MTDLDAYLHRIAYTGPREPTLGVLTAICAAHSAAIAFENIDPLLGRPPSLAPEALHAKLIEQRRGGYCYEQNAVLRLALLQLGFQVTALAARVVWMSPAEMPPRARSHMLLKVELSDALQGSFIVDAGFGGRLIAAPLRLQPSVVQPTPSGDERITQDADGYAVEADLGASAGGWVPRYRFTLEPHRPVDYEPLNWFTATHPGSLFVNNLVMERLRPELRANLLNDRLTLCTMGGAPQVRRIESAADFAQVLDTVFDLQPPVQAAELFARVPKGLDGPLTPRT
jgi:N-hydroxyarylamine O-acetyltransferase